MTTASGDGGSARPGVVTWSGLAMVAGAAAVLSFATVRDLALASGYPPNLAWLLPVVIDATAVVGSRIWLGGATQPGAVRYARTLALAAAVVTIGANVLQHGLAAYHLAPPWWLVAALAAIPPTALVAVAHQVALLTRPGDAAAPEVVAPVVEVPVVEVPVVEVPVRMVADKPEDLGDELGEAAEAPGAELVVVAGDADAYNAELRGRARRLMAESPVPVGRRRLAELLAVSDWQARQLLADLTPDLTSDTGSGPESDLTYARS